MQIVICDKNSINDQTERHLKAVRADILLVSTIIVIGFL